MRTAAATALCLLTLCALIFVCTDVCTLLAAFLFLAFLFSLFCGFFPLLFVVLVLVVVVSATAASLFMRRVYK